MVTPLMTEHAFDTMRLVLVVIAVLLRLALMPIYLQAYLNMAYHRVEAQKKEAGRITNTELQKKVFFFMQCIDVHIICLIILFFFFK